MAIIMCLPKELLDTIEEIKVDCEKLKKEKDLNSFGEGQLHMANILIDIIVKWRKERNTWKNKRVV